MKKLFLLAVMTATVLTSCSTSKPTTDYQYQKQQSAEQQRPGRTKRTLEPCIAMAQEDSKNLRAYGTATSYVEKTAINEAHRDARNRLAQMMKVAIEGAAQDYSQNATQNLKSSAETLGEEIMTQFVAEEIKNTRTIETSIYDLTDGSIQVYVCVEMRSALDDFCKNLENTLDREGIIGIQYDRKQFIEQTKAGLEEYKKKNKVQ